MSELNQDVVKTYAKAKRIIAVALSECSHPTLLPCDHEGNATAIVARLGHAGILLQSGEECERCDNIEQKARSLIQYFARYGEVTHEQVDKLREAVGMTKEEVAVATDRCECHERDGSYVCESCFKKGMRGHMQRGGG